MHFRGIKKGDEVGWKKIKKQYEQAMCFKRSKAK